MPKVADQLERLTATLQAIGDALPASYTRPADLSTVPAPLVAPGPAPSASAAMSVPAAEADLMATLAQIAEQHLGIVTLEERKRDRLDFYEVSVRSVVAALRAAHQAGIAARLQQGCAEASDPAMTTSAMRDSQIT